MTSPDRSPRDVGARDAAPAPDDGRVTIERIPYDAQAWAAIVHGHPEAEVYHGRAWLGYLAATQGADPVVAVVRAGGRPIGYFVGAVVRRYGLRILGSPLRGWGTMAMGFLLDPGADRRAAAEALPAFAFGQLGCVHLELADRQLTGRAMAGSGFRTEIGATFVVDMAPPEDAIFAAMRPTTRNYVRQGERKGLVVERARGLDFADEYYAQLIEVFARQGLAPTYGIERVRALIRALDATEEVLLLRVLDPSGACIASLVVVGGNRSAILWGAAFRRASADLHPNEVMHWAAIRYWRARGVRRYDMGGDGSYKAKYGGAEVEVAHFHRSRWQILVVGRSVVRSGFRLVQAARFRLRRRRRGGAAGSGEGGDGAVGR